MRPLGLDSDLVDVDDLIEFAERYQDLGHAVQEQLSDLLDSDFDDVNPNAVDEIRRGLFGIHEDIDGALDEYDEWLNEREREEKEWGPASHTDRLPEV